MSYVILLTIRKENQRHNYELKLSNKVLIENNRIITLFVVNVELLDAIRYNYM